MLDRIAQARAHRQGGRYADALALLVGSEDWPAPENESATLLRAQILARRAPIEALELLARSQDVFVSTEGKFGYYVASMRAYTGTRNYEATLAMGERAQALADQVDIAERCTLWHQRAILRTCLEQYDPLDADLIALIASKVPNGEFLGYETRSYMHAGLADYAGQTADLMTALDVAMKNPGACDPGIVAQQVHMLLRLALEMGNEAAATAAADAYEWMPWSDDLQDQRFLCVRALAWISFLRGDSAQAQWLLKDSKAFATTEPWKVMAHLDRAYIARMNGNEHWAADELLAADAIARTVEWSATFGEERQALVMLAVLFSPSDMAQAQHYVSQYTQLGRANIDPLLSLGRDRRAVAFEKYAQGRVQQVLGNDVLAMGSFREAYDVFASSSYDFRASLAAMGLFEITGDETWLARARQHAETFPRSALRATLNQERASEENARMRELSPMQRQIAMALCEGLDLAALSQRFSRSAFTLSKHVDAVFEHLGVKNRNALREAVQCWAVF
jgi:DNA-binding CsgD family transcriptional regulator